MPKIRRLKWTVEIAVDVSWIADGFELTAERAKAMVHSDLKGAYDDEIKTRIVSKPSDKAIAILQGYRSVAAMRRANEEN